MSAMREMLPKALFTLYPQSIRLTITHTIHVGSIVSINSSHYFHSNYIDNICCMCHCLSLSLSPFSLHSLLPLCVVWSSNESMAGDSRRQADSALCHPAMRGDPGIRALLVQAGSLETDWGWQRDGRGREGK